MIFCKEKPIFTSLSPNTEKDDIWLAFKLILRPWKWRQHFYHPWRFCHSERSEESHRNCFKFGILPPPSNRRRDQNDKKNAVSALEEEFKNYLGIKHAFAFNSGRSAFLAILSGLGLEQDSEILLQAFTCNAAVNPIIWSGLKPVFVDIKEETLNIDPEDLERKLASLYHFFRDRRKVTTFQNSKKRAVIVQHTFGLPADLDKISEICQKHNLILIEDCAHSLGAVCHGITSRGYHGKLSRGDNKQIGMFGKASFFSFGRDKIISSVYGGMAVTNDDELAQKIKQFQEKCKTPSYFWIFQQLMHPILCNFLIIPLYGFFGLGRWVLLGLQRLKILSKAVHKKEKGGQKPEYIPQKMPNALAILALNQFRKLDKFISHQRQIAEFYNRNLSNVLRNDLVTLAKKEGGRVYMRYPILIKNKSTDEILKRARKQKIFLDDGWRKTPIMPPNTNQEKMGYISSSCPVAEEVAKNILNLPMHINISQEKAQRIVNFLKEIL